MKKVLIISSSPRKNGNSDLLAKEFQNPTKLDADKKWKYWTVAQPRENSRTRSMSELLFCMLRSKHSATNL